MKEHWWAINMKGDHIVAQNSNGRLEILAENG
jgi:hypothetical protein